MDLDFMLLFAWDYWKTLLKQYTFLLLEIQASIDNRKFAQKWVWTFMCHAGIS